MDWSSCVDQPNQPLNVATISCVFTLYQYVLDAAFLFAGAAAVIFIIVAGYKFIRSGGDPKQVEGARKTMTFSIIGLLLLLFSFAIINFIADFTGTSCIKVFGFDSCLNEAGKQALDACVPDTPYTQADRDASGCICKAGVGILNENATWAGPITCEVALDGSDEDTAADQSDDTAVSGTAKLDGKIPKTFFECDTNGNNGEDIKSTFVNNCQ